MAQPYPLRPTQPVHTENSDKPTYQVAFSVAPTAAMDLVSIKAGAGKVIRVRRIRVDNPGLQTTGAVVNLQWGYAADVGSGGAVAGSGNYGLADGDPASTATTRTGDTTVAAGFVAQGVEHVFVPAAAGAFAAVDRPLLPTAKAPTVRADVAAATTFVLRHPGAAGAAGFAGSVEYTEEVL